MPVVRLLFLNSRQIHLHWQLVMPELDGVNVSTFPLESVAGVSVLSLLHGQPCGARSSCQTQANDSLPTSTSQLPTQEIISCLLFSTLATGITSGLEQPSKLSPHPAGFGHTLNNRLWNPASEMGFSFLVCSFLGRGGSTSALEYSSEFSFFLS